MDLKKYIRSIPDYPKKGILFRDITTLIKNPEAFKFTNDKIITIPKNKIMTITNASTEMSSSYFNIASNYDLKPTPLRNQNYKVQKLTDEDNDKINEFLNFSNDNLKKILYLLNLTPLELIRKKEKIIYHNFPINYKLFIKFLFYLQKFNSIQELF